MGDLPKYQVDLTSILNKKYRGYMEIPFALFSELPNYVQGQEKSFVCIGATFNQNPEVFHPFDDGDVIKRDRWEIAKTHMASTDNNDFIIHQHLGILHYASAIYTTAFCNAAKSNPEWKWLS